MPKKYIAIYTTHMANPQKKNFLKHILEPVLLLSWNRSKTGLVKNDKTFNLSEFGRE